MAKLTSKKRNALPAAQFAGPDRSYPIPDASHAANAKARATQQVAKGNLAPSTAAKIKAAANRKLASAGVHPSFPHITAGAADRDHYTPKNS